jgi:hypothetical protein
MEPYFTVCIGRIGPKRRILAEHVIGFSIFGAASRDDKVLAFSLCKHSDEFKGRGKAPPV